VPCTIGANETDNKSSLIVPLFYIVAVLNPPKTIIGKKCREIIAGGMMAMVTKVILGLQILSLTSQPCGIPNCLRTTNKDMLMETYHVNHHLLKHLGTTVGNDHIMQQWVQINLVAQSRIKMPRFLEVIIIIVVVEVVATIKGICRAIHIFILITITE
jgi:hypothetical protein